MGALPKRGHPKRDQNRASGSTKPTLLMKVHCKNQISTSRSTTSASPKREDSIKQQNQASKSPPTTSHKDRHPQKGKKNEIKRGKPQDRRTKGQTYSKTRKPHHIAIYLGHMQQKT